MKRRPDPPIVEYAFASTPLGRLLVARTERGICAAALGDTDTELLESLRFRHPGSRLQAATNALQPEIAWVLAHLHRTPPPEDALPLDLGGTPFQREAWAVMQAIPRGETLTYQQLAARLGRPRGQVAAGQACAANPVALLIPCHRILAAGNRAHYWRWGVARKRQLLEMERHKTLPSMQSPGRRRPRSLSPSEVCVSSR